MTEVAGTRRPYTGNNSRTHRFDKPPQSAEELVVIPCASV